MRVYFTVNKHNPNKHNSAEAMGEHKGVERDRLLVLNSVKYLSTVMVGSRSGVDWGIDDMTMAVGRVQINSEK